MARLSEMAIPFPQHKAHEEAVDLTNSKKSLRDLLVTKLSGYVVHGIEENLDRKKASPPRVSLPR
jgi:hypothetical protein